MNYVHYDIVTTDILGFYNTDIVPVIPEPNIALTDEEWGTAIDEGHNKVLGGKTVFVPYELTPLELEAQEKKLLRQARATATREIVVTTAAGNTFPGDELSQDRLARVLLVTDPLSTVMIPWEKADGSAAQVLIHELREVLTLSVEAESLIWFPLPT